MMVLIDCPLLNDKVSLIFFGAFFSISFVSVLKCLLTVRLLLDLCKMELAVSWLLLSFEVICHALLWLKCQRTFVVNF